MRFLSCAVLIVSTMTVLPPAGAQQSDCTLLRPLYEIPEIPSKDGLLQGVILLKDPDRFVAGGNQGTPCRKQGLRYFEGYSTQHPKEPWPHPGDPIPGPTLRARVGDLVQLTFLNQIDYRNFSSSLDQGELGKTTGCDRARIPDPQNPDEKTILTYPRMGEAPQGDSYPNCLHGSSTANIHFHGTHTTPSTTGDNVLLFIRPALRQGDKILPEDSFVEQQFAKFFQWCAANGAPTSWKQMPIDWQKAHGELLHVYDKTAPYQGEIGKLPHHLRLWPKTEKQIADGLWPQYSIGAFPYCFSLPKYDPTKVRMGQAPGTHWYHAHKHGSTSLNVGNGMVGAFIIEGEYDEALREFYKPTPEHKNWKLEEKVLVIQQIQTQLNLLSASPPGPPPLSVNGRLNPVITMKPNQVQRWRVVNTAPIHGVQFHSFTAVGGQSPAWRQIAQDGVQFHFESYERVGKPNTRFYLAAANRADLLVRAPAQAGEYALQVVRSVRDIPAANDPKSILLTAKVKGDDKPIDPPMDFIEKEEDFPKLPQFLADVSGPISVKRELRFNTVPHSSQNAETYGLPLHKIDNKLFNPHEIAQTMTLDASEEWTIFNETTDIAHPFHIHINPFQIVELFQPNHPDVKTPGHPCYADPTKPETWQPCEALQLKPPYVWWDVFGIPTARQDTLPDSACTEDDQCPNGTTCKDGKCVVTIPGYFKKRSRFVDFPGQYVFHCHILAHEDRGMMELVEVVGKTEYEHH